MKFKKLLALVLSAVMALSILAGCGKNSNYSDVAVQIFDQLMDGKTEMNFEEDADLLKALQDAISQGNGDLSTIRNLVVQALGVKNVFSFSVSGAGAAKDGQHGIAVCRVTGKTPEEAARNAFAQVKGVLEALLANGTYKTYVSMVKYGDDYYLSLDLAVVKAGTSTDTSTDEGTQQPTQPPQPAEPSLDDYGEYDEDTSTLTIRSNANLVGLADAINKANAQFTTVDTVDFSNYKGEIPAGVLEGANVEEVVVNADSKLDPKAFAGIDLGGKPLTITVKGDGTINKSILSGAQKVSLALEDVEKIESGTGVFTASPALTSVYMPSVTQIGPAAFAGCTNLKNVYLGAGVSIGKGAFNGCTNLRAVYCAGSTAPSWNDNIGWKPDEKVSFLDWLRMTNRDQSKKYLVYGVPSGFILEDAWPNG